MSVLSRYIHLNPVRIKGLKDKPLEERWKYLVNYLWSSLRGYLDQKNKEPFLEYATVLDDFGGDTNRGRRAYQKRIYEDLTGELEIKDRVVGQAVLGGDHFIKWLKKTFYPKGLDRERPALHDLKRYKAVEEITEILSEETGTTIEEVKVKGHPLRPVFMDLLYRAGGLTGVEIGKIFGVDYSTVSQIRKRMRLRTAKDKKLREVINRIEKRMSI